MVSEQLTCKGEIDAYSRIAGSALPDECGVCVCVNSATCLFLRRELRKGPQYLHWLLCMEM